MLTTRQCDCALSVFAYACLGEGHSPTGLLLTSRFDINICWLLPGTYLETDFDRSVTRDISVQSRSEPARETVRQASAPAERGLSDIPRKPSRVDQLTSRQSHPQSAGHVGERSSGDKIPALTGGRYPAYKGPTSQPAYASPWSQQQQQQWRRHGSYQDTFCFSALLRLLTISLSVVQLCKCC